MVTSVHPIKAPHSIYFGRKIWNVGIGWYVEETSTGASRHGTLADARRRVRDLAKGPVYGEWEAHALLGLGATCKDARRVTWAKRVLARLT